MIQFIRSLFTFRLRPLYVVRLTIYGEKFNWYTVEFNFARWPTVDGILRAIRDRRNEVQSWVLLSKDHTRALDFLADMVFQADKKELADCKKHINGSYRNNLHNSFVVRNGRECLGTVRVTLEKVWA